MSRAKSIRPSFPGAQFRHVSGVILMWANAGPGKKKMVESVTVIMIGVYTLGRKETT
jgi:hypothetical protein